MPSALVLKQGSDRYYLLRVQQKDTREDSSQTDLLLVDREGMPVLVDDLSAPSAPSAKPLGQVAAWLRARWVNQAQALQKAQPQPEHTAITPGAYLAVAQSPAAGNCHYALGTPESPEPGLTITKPCRAIKASSAFQQGAASWFVVSVEDGDPASRILVFEVTPQGAHEMPELEAALRAKAGDGKILPLRQALQRLVSNRR